MPPRALSPVGVALVDKPAGPSSFALVAALRRRTRARTGHAGTLDPFATGLLVLLSGAATRLAPCFVGLDKRYLTDVALTATTTTGDPEGDVARASIPRRAGPSSTPRSSASVARSSCRSRLRRRSRSAASAPTAWRGRESPSRCRSGARSSTSSTVVAYTGDEPVTAVRLDLRVSSGTYVRAIAQALGGHCTSLRRLTVGPFSVEEAADVEAVELMPPSAALERLSDEHLARVAATVRAGVLALEQPTGGGAA